MSLKYTFGKRLDRPKTKSRFFDHEKSPVIKPCPKCGGRGIEHRSDSKYWVKCDVRTCKYSPGVFDTREQAIEAWGK